MANAYSVVIEGALCREATAVTITVTLTTNLAKLPGDAAPQGANCNCIYRAVDVDAVQSTMATATPQKLKTAKTSNDKGASVHTSI